MHNANFCRNFGGGCAVGEAKHTSMQGKPAIFMAEVRERVNYLMGPSGSH